MSDKVILLASADTAQRYVCESFLTQGGYEVIVATNLEEARQKAEGCYFHVAVVNSEPGASDLDVASLDLVATLKEKAPWAACIFLGDKDFDTLKAASDMGAKFVQRDKASFETDLLGEVKRLYDSKVRINFKLAVEFEGKRRDDALDSMLIGLDLKQVNIEDPAHRVAIRKELGDLLGKLFYNCEEITIDLLRQGYSGAGLRKVMSYRMIGGRTCRDPYVVLKYGERGKIEKETENFNAHGKRIADNRRPERRGAEYTKHLGGVVDTYIGFSLEEPPDFDIVYKQRQGKAEDEEFKAHVKTLHTILDDLFTNAFRLWYEQRGAARQLDFRRLYEQRLISDELQERFEGSFPQCRGRHWIRFPELGPQGFRTFVYDLDELEFKKVVGHSDVITHGDLNGRNILIHEGKPWPIDFYHTGPGHLLRDFVKLESCIKFELMETESPEALRQFEDVLNMPYPPEADLSFAYHWNPEDLIKAYRVITHLRELAVREAKASWTQIRDEYYIGLFYQTLAVLQYSIREARKKHALLSANKIYDLVTA